MKKDNKIIKLVTGDYNRKQYHKDSIEDVEPWICPVCKKEDDIESSIQIEIISEVMVKKGEIIPDSGVKKRVCFLCSVKGRITPVT